MGLLIGKTAPDFTTQAVHAGGEIVDDFNFHSAIDGKYAVLFFYPLDFTFVCPSEILAMSHRTAKLNELGCEVVGVSVDCLLYTSPSPRDRTRSRMPSSA